MSINVLSEIPKEKAKDEYFIGTHNGIFHCDEVVAVAILCLINNDKKISVIRTRDKDVLKDCDIRVDVGGQYNGKLSNKEMRNNNPTDFDHHQTTFSIERPNDIKLKYASAGLIFEEYGEKLIKQVLLENKKDNSLIEPILKKINEDIIMPVDAEDNGVDLKEPHIMNFIPMFCPSWFEEKPDYNGKFLEALNITINLLENKIRDIISKIYARETIKALREKEEFFSNGILLIPAQTMPWTETVCELNSSLDSDKNKPKKYINFVMFPYPNGGYAVQCVPPSLTDKYGQRISFPKEWARTEVKGDITFIHTGGFFARGKTKEALINLCERATKIEEEKWAKQFEKYGDGNLLNLSNAINAMNNGNNANKGNEGAVKE